ncbi:hypothetical protein VNO77_25006 [Canavalia gladiata]|uniref:Uncharacterized protein n=1 Tax=Canavalia gladiata TaxID=3824 RepID=A0AAN9L8Q6_CANGL
MCFPLYILMFDHLNSNDECHAGQSVIMPRLYFDLLVTRFVRAVISNVEKAFFDAFLFSAMDVWGLLL